MGNEPGSLYLLAGGRRGSRTSPDPLIQAVLRNSGVSSPEVAYVGTANGDDRWFFERMANHLRQAGAGKVDHAMVVPEKADLRKAQRILYSADVIFISGGDADEGMRVLRDKGMVDFLREIYDDRKLFFGLSGGSIMLARKWVRWRDPNDDLSAELFPCLGFAPIICDTHDEQDNWGELKVALRLAEDERGYGIVSGTALKVYANGKVEALGGPVHQLLRRGKRIIRIPDILPAS